MKVFSAAFAVLSAASFVAGHMEMKDPPPLRSQFNKNTQKIDYDMTSPMSSNGVNFPCRGHHKHFNTSEGEPTREYTAGETYSLTIVGGAFHSGGSCQESLSYDKGKSWTVIQSHIGCCPVSPGETKYNFTVPSDATLGKALFGWSWFNKVGNREMYMNCAAVTIEAGQSSEKQGTDVPMSQRPQMFVANVGNNCTTADGTDLEFPNPGPDVEMCTSDKVKLAGPSGDGCQKPAPGGGDKPSKPSNPSKPSPTPPKATPPQSTSTGEKFPGEQNKPAQPPSSPTNSTKPTKPTFPALPPTPPSNGNNSTSFVKPQPTSTPASAPTQVAPTPGDDNDVCTPGVFGCTPDNAAWRVCAVTQNWVRAGECPQGTVCRFNEMNKTPYCVQNFGALSSSPKKEVLL